MKILHLDLKPIGDDYAELRYFWDNPNDYQSHQPSLAELDERIKQAETDYYEYVDFYSIDYAKTGQALYNWLDGSDRILQSAIDRHWRRGIVLAISTSERLAHLPWEVLHDGKSFLMERKPATIPVRWVKDEDDRQLAFENEPANRALNVLFMATAPRGIEPELKFEAEEGHILEATKRIPLSLTVEESGCLTELGYLVEGHERDYFDVIHLTGHAEFRDGKPRFITETEFGDPEYSIAEDIATELEFQLPKLIFLSGCQTGYSGDKGTVPSMAEELLKLGATAVLGWGHNVRDLDATRASATLYQELSAGKTLVESVALTYQELLRNQARDWHLLRLYVAETIPGALVKRGRKPVPRPTHTDKFVDPERKLRVAKRETFVGRRRQLQNCLRVLKTSTEEVGVLIHGMGGLGKSTIAARLCDRLSEHKILVWSRQIDESSFVNKLADELTNSQQRTAIKESKEKLKYRLRDIFETLNQPEEKPFLLVFDDFEWNLEPRQGRYVLKPEVAEVLSSLVWAIQETYTNHRIIITSRYNFESDILQSFYKQPLEAFQDSQLQKYLSRLENFDEEKVDEELIKRALNLADGNPRLLEWLNDEVLLAEDADVKLSQSEASPKNWKKKIIWELENQPKLQLDQTVEKIISHCLVFEIPVPREALEAVCDLIPDYQEEFSRAIELGLIEVSPEPEEPDRVYRVSRILPHIIPKIRLPEAPKVYSLYHKANEKLYELWGKQENESEEKWGEIFRLLFADKDNPQRFRQGYSQISVVQPNRTAIKSFFSFFSYSSKTTKMELLKENELSEESFYNQLENYLRQGDWRKADEETAWLFYIVMVHLDKTGPFEFFGIFPREILNKIDLLWVRYSRGHFGFSIQKHIWENIKNEGNWSKEFGEQIGWFNIKYGETVQLPFPTEQVPWENFPKGNLPARCYLSDGLRAGPYQANPDYFRHLFDDLLFSRIKT